MKSMQNIEKVLTNFLNELNETIDYESGSVFVYDGETSSLKEASKIGDGIDFISSIHFPMGSGLSAWVAQRGQLIYLDDIHRGSRHGMKPIRSYLSMPLEFNDELVGVLNLSHIVPNAFNDDKMNTIKTMGKRIARTIHNQKN